MKKLNEIFYIWYGVNLELVNCEEIENGIPFVSRTSNNNGIVGYVKEIDEIGPNPENTLSVACSGSVLSTFYHPYKYYSGRDVYILKAKPQIALSQSEMIFYCAVIEKNKYKYNYGRQVNKTLKDIIVPSPEEIPANVKTHKTNIPFDNTPLCAKKIGLNASSWKPFKLFELFDIYTSQDENQTESDDTGNTPYISSTKSNNGMSCCINAEPSHENNTITVARNGSVGSAFYQPCNYCASPDDVRIFKPKFDFNKYIGLFITVLIEKEKYRYAYGRKYGSKRMKETTISLPAKDDGSPDWMFMENYIKSLPYSKAI